MRFGNGKYASGRKRTRREAFLAEMESARYFGDGFRPPSALDVQIHRRSQHGPLCGSSCAESEAAVFELIGIEPGAPTARRRPAALDALRR